jgi:nitric oxide reductase subunit B
LFYVMRFVSGIAVVVGALLFIYSILVVRRREVVAPGAANPGAANQAPAKSDPVPGE